MSSFWGSLFEHLRDCGRNATLFLIALAGIGLVLLAGLILSEFDVLERVTEVWPLLAAIAAAWIFLTIRRALRRHRERIRFPPLSCDELRVARSKLMRDRKAKDL
jgi:hypothetical protein